MEDNNTPARAAHHAVRGVKGLKSDLSLRPIYHHEDLRIEAHIVVAFLAYCLYMALRAKLKPLSSGLTPRAVLEKFAAMQMVDAHVPTTDQRELVLSRHTELDEDLQLLLMRIKLELRARSPPKIRLTSPENRVKSSAL